MNKLLIGLLLLIFIGIVFLFSQNRTSDNLFPSYESKDVKIGNDTFHLYIADTNAKREQGLSGVTTLPEKTGMIFVYSTPSFYHFWMKDMNFALDFVYIKNNKIVDLQENISPNTYPSTFTSKTQADSIIEFNPGTIKKYQFKEGMLITEL
jgi:uncharacterized membrane protein (UPF0127 family)